MRELGNKLKLGGRFSILRGVELDRERDGVLSAQIAAVERESDIIGGAR